MTQLPFPSNENTTGLQTSQPIKAPWKRVNPGEPPVMMFQIHWVDGRSISYAYCDLREVRVRDAGQVTLCLFGMEKLHICIEGRHLTELADHISGGRIKSIMELGPRTFDRPEDSPSIDKISIEILTGPAY